MEEKMLVLDCLNSLNEMIKFENESILKITNIEYRGYFKAVRLADEAFQEEIRNLGISKGYFEKTNDIDENKVEKLKQNIMG